MKSAFWLTAAAGLVGSTMAEGVHRRHGHNLFHRRGGGDVEAPGAEPSCGCTTKVITYYGEPALSTPPVQSTTTVQSTSYTTKTVSVSPKPQEPEPTPEPSPEPSPAPSPETTAAPEPAPEKPKPQPKPEEKEEKEEKEDGPGLDLPIPDIDIPEIPKPEIPEPSIGGKGDKYGITYSPFTKDSGCKDSATVSKDMEKIKSAGFSAVRIYSPTDCDGLSLIGDACKENDLKMIIGVFLDSTGAQGAQKQIDTISKWAQWDMCDLVVIGNESIFSAAIDGAGLAQLINKAKGAFKAAGYKGKVTTTETVNIWQANAKALCSAVDVVGANIHPYFNTATSAFGAGKFVKSQMDIVKDLCGGKEVVNLETGWPKQGNSNGAAIPGIVQQLTAVTSIVKEAGSKSVFMSYGDEEWKETGQYGIENSFGCIDSFLGM